MAAEEPSMIFLNFDAFVEALAEAAGTIEKAKALVVDHDLINRELSKAATALHYARSVAVELARAKAAHPE